MWHKAMHRASHTFMIVALITDSLSKSSKLADNHSLVSQLLNEQLQRPVSLESSALSPRPVTTCNWHIKNAIQPKRVMHSAPKPCKDLHSQFPHSHLPSHYWGWNYDPLPTKMLMPFIGISVHFRKDFCELRWWTSNCCGDDRFRHRSLTGFLAFITIVQLQNWRSVFVGQ